MTLYMFVGSCNQPTPYFANANGKGVSVFAFEPQTGQSELVARHEGIDNPTFLSVTPDACRIYANSEKFGHAQGLVTALSFNPEAKTIRHLDMVASRGSITSHNSISTDQRFLLATNYAEGCDGPNQSVVVFPLTDTAAIGAACSAVAHKGKGPNAARQDRSHAHFVHQLPNGLVAVADLGMDKVLFYHLSGAGDLQLSHLVDLPAGSGPRHLAWSRGGGQLFVVGELDNTVTSLALHADGTATLTDRISTLMDPASNTHCSDIQISQDGRFLYVGNRGDDTIATISIAPGGHLKLVDLAPCGGATPRALALSPCGSWLLSANQDSDVIAVIPRDQHTGMLQKPEHLIAVGTPMSIKFAATQR